MTRRLNITSREFTGNLVLSPNPTRSFLIIYVRVGVIEIEFGDGGGSLQFKAGETFAPKIVPTSKLKIVSGGTYVVATNGFKEHTEANMHDLHGFIVEDDFTQMTTQTTSVQDVPQTVLYGPPKISPNNMVSVSAAGVITVLNSNFYAIKTRHLLGRTGGAGTSRLFMWVEISLDGTNWFVSGNPVYTSLDNADESKIFFDMAFVYLHAGTHVRARWARSSTGHNSGNLVSISPSTTLANLGVQPVASAQLTIYRPDE